MPREWLAATRRNPASFTGQIVGDVYWPAACSAFFGESLRPGGAS